MFEWLVRTVRWKTQPGKNRAAHYLVSDPHSTYYYWSNKPGVVHCIQAHTLSIMERS